VDWSGKRVLVTGAGGFIGSHLAEHLVTLGARVRAFVRYNSRNSCGWIDTFPDETRRSLEVFAGDIRDAEEVRKASQDVEYIFHLAALIAIPYSYSAVESYIDTNIRGSLNVLMAARSLEACRVIHTSTSEVYGAARHFPISEDETPRPQSPYAATKLAADVLALSFHRSYELPVAVIRPFNAYGPRQSARAVIPTVMLQCLEGGTELVLGATHPTRDFLYVQDVVRGFARIAETDAVIGEIVNIGTGTEISIRDVVGFVQQMVGKELSITQDVERLRPEESEVQRLCADIHKAQRLIAWQPEVGLEEGLRYTFEWFRDHRNHYQSGREYVV
jgi:NAD dependent epimerase/dehydratase